MSYVKHYEDYHFLTFGEGSGKRAMHGNLPLIEIVKTEARIGHDKRPCCYVYLIRYNSKTHIGGWANEMMAKEYADKLFIGEVRPKLLAE
jgi:hypothetical protein